MTKAEYEQYLQTPAWANRRASALERASGRCQVCNEPTGLEVHHRTYERVGREPPEDLTVLCAHCHALFHDTLAVRRSRHFDAAARQAAENTLERLARTPPR